jgi:antitoxin MazE
MKVLRWRDSLALRIPAELAERLQLNEGDEVLMEVDADGRALVVRRDTSRNEALDGLRALGWNLPESSELSREAANERN